MTFEPKPELHKVHSNLTLRVSETDYAKILAAAEKCGLNTTSFVRQAVMYAVKNMVKP